MPVQLSHLVSTRTVTESTVGLARPPERIARPVQDALCTPSLSPADAMSVGGHARFPDSITRNALYAESLPEVRLHSTSQDRVLSDAEERAEGIRNHLISFVRAYNHLDVC